MKKIFNFNKRKKINFNYPKKPEVMKKSFGIILIVSMLIQGIKAQDTLYWCASTPPSPLQDPYWMYAMCPYSFGLGNLIIFNGDTVSFGFELLPGSEGIMEVYCDSFFDNDGILDSSFYFIGNAQPQICIITSDSNNHPVLYFDTSTFYGNYPILLKRQVTTVSWQTVAIINDGDPLPIVDITANMATQAYYYKLESAGCEGWQHKTIHLEANGNNLTWNEYQGVGIMQLRGYYIHKRDSSGNFSLIDSTASTTYTDLNFHNGDEYFVEAFKDDACPPVIWKRSSAISVKSNKLKIATTGIGTPEQILLKYYADGSTLYVELKQVDDVWIHDLVGRELLHEHTIGLSVELPSGMYVMTVGMKGYKVLIH